MPDLMKLHSVSRDLAETACSHTRRPTPSLINDDELAAEYDRARGYGRPRAERAKEAYEDAADAPVVTWTPPARRR